MTGTKTAPRSSSTLALSSSAFSPVAYSKMNNIMRYNKIQERINTLTSIYENLKETTYNMDSTIMNMWKNWIDDKDNKFNTYLINYTLDGHNTIMNERLKRIDNLYIHIYQLEKERDLINIEYSENLESDEETESEDEQEYHPRLFGPPQNKEEPQNREELEKVLHIKLNEYNGINEYRNYLLYTILRDREQFMTEEGIKHLRKQIDELADELKKLMIPIAGIRNEIDQIVKEKDSIIEFNRWTKSPQNYNVTDDARNLTRRLISYFTIVDHQDFLFKFMKNDYICEHTVEKLLREFERIDEQQIKYPDSCARENHSIRQLDGFFDYPQVNEIRCANCANNGIVKGHYCYEGKKSQLSIYNYLNRIYEYTSDEDEHLFIKDIISTIENGGYCEESDNIINGDYDTVINIIEYLIEYYEDGHSYSYINLIPEYIFKAIQDLFLILVYLVIQV